MVVHASLLPHSDMLHRVAALVLPVVLAWSCRGSADSRLPVREASPVQTDTTEYRLRPVGGGYEATAVATYVNRTGASIYFPRCGVGSYAGPCSGTAGQGPTARADSSGMRIGRASAGYRPARSARATASPWNWGSAR